MIVLVLLPRGTLVRALGLFLAAVVFALALMILVSWAEGDPDSAYTRTTGDRTAPTAVTGHRTCEPFCGAVPNTGP